MIFRVVKIKEETFWKTKKLQFISYVNFSNNGIKYFFGFTMYMKYIRIKLKEMLTMSKKCVENIESLTEAVKRMNAEEVERESVKKANLAEGTPNINKKPAENIESFMEAAKRMNAEAVESERVKKANLAEGTPKINKR